MNHRVHMFNKQLNFIFMSPSQRNDPDCFIVSHGGDEKDHVLGVVEGYMLVSNFAISCDGTRNEGSVCSRKDKTTKKINGTLKRVVMLSAVTHFLSLVVCDLCATNDYAEVFRTPQGAIH